jgi:hypothetical protein
LQKYQVYGHVIGSGGSLLWNIEPKEGILTLKTNGTMRTRFQVWYRIKLPETWRQEEIGPKILVPTEMVPDGCLYSWFSSAPPKTSIVALSCTTFTTLSTADKELISETLFNSCWT